MGLDKAKAVLQKASDPKALQELNDRVVERSLQAKYLPEELDLTVLEDYNDEKLVYITEESIQAIQEHESQIFRHAVRVATALNILERRERERMGDTFRKKQWLTNFLENHYKGRLSRSTAMLYQQIARPENQEKAAEFSRKIDTLQQLRETGLPEEEITKKAVSKGIAEWEIEMLPERFSLRELSKYLAQSNRADRDVASLYDETVTITIEGPDNCIDAIELDLKKYLAREHLMIPTKDRAALSKELKSKKPGQVKRTFSYPRKEKK